MTFTTAFLAASFVVPSMPPPEYDDCEVVTNCVFDASRSDARVFSVRIELDATPSNGVAECRLDGGEERRDDEVPGGAEAVAVLVAAFH